MFQSTPPRGRRLYIAATREGLERFNPRLREGGDNMRVTVCIIRFVSIHASAREATCRVYWLTG